VSYDIDIDKPNWQVARISMNPRPIFYQSNSINVAIFQSQLRPKIQIYILFRAGMTVKFLRTPWTTNLQNATTVLSFSFISCLPCLFFSIVQYVKREEFWFCHKFIIYLSSFTHLSLFKIITK
jgi:hypothetical protein